MNIACDIDDTLTESFDYFQPYVAEFFHADLNDLRKKNISYINLPDEWKDREIPFYRAYFDKIVPDTTFKAGAAEAIARLKKEGHKIFIVTARTKDFYTDPYYTSAKELVNGGISYDKLICTFDKADACVKEGISVLIDDFPANCAAVNERGIPALLFTSKANEACVCENRRVSSWKEAVVAVDQIYRGYPDKKYAAELLKEAEAVNPGRWGDHCRVAAFCAGRIAEACGMNAEKAEVLALLHDIGRKFLIRDLGHIYNGYKYMQRMGFSAVARACLTHSFPSKNVSVYIGKPDIEPARAEELKSLLSACEYDDYDRLIQLCDALASADGVVDVEARMADVKKRYGNYPQEQWDKNLELLGYFGQKAGKSVYEICGKAE